MKTAVTTAIFILCLPPLFVPVNPDSWRIRLVCLLLLFPLMTAVACYYLITVRTSAKARGAVPKNPEFFRKVCRIAVLGTTLLFTLGVLIPLELSGVEALVRGHLEDVTGQVTDNDMVFGTWFIMQRLTVNLQGNPETLTYFLSARPVRVGEHYHFWLLNDFPIVLQHEKLVQ